MQEAENVYSHEEVVASDHEHWGICGIQDIVSSPLKLLIFDVDIHKAPDNFDGEHITVTTDDTPLIKSQSGGAHTYAAIRADEAGQESDFSVTTYIPFDIDIRGSYVKHHVVAPNDIPGVETDYEIKEDSRINIVEPADACEFVRYVPDLDDVDNSIALLEHNPDGGGYDGGIAIDRDVEPPEEMPTCYHRGLQVRHANPDDPDANTHKVNVLTALCGLAAGYSIDDMVEHFVDDFPPGPNADEEETRYQLKHIAEKVDGGDYSPPAISTLREYGILEDGETCNCDIAYHGGTPVTRGMTSKAAADGGVAADEGGSSGPGPTSPDGSRYEYDIEHPVYEVLPPDEGDVELHIIPINGTTVGVEVTQNGQVEYSEVLDPGFWNSRTLRGRIASETANTLTGVDHSEVKQSVKDALTQVGIDERENSEEFEEAMRTERERTLRDRTERVICHPTGDSAEWVVTMIPPEESPVTEPRELSFDEGDFNDSNAGAFRNAHLAKFFVKVEIDHEEWSNLTNYWLEQQVTDDYEPDLELDAAVDKFVDWVENLRIWADEGGFSWSSLHGYYAEDYHEEEDAVLVSGQKVADWRDQENIDPQLNLSKELRKRGIMLTSTAREEINGKRWRVWPVAADATPHTPETAHTVDSEDQDEDEEDRPEGLR